MRRLGIAVLVSAALAPVATARAAELVTLTTPSRFVDPARVSFNGADHPRELRVNVLLPDGYDPAREYPVLFLLHGVGDAYDSWADPAKGDIRNTAKGFPGILVMPEGARGFYTDWFNGGLRGSPGWESYQLEELIPFIESRFPIRRGRGWHAVAGLSMGGFGAAYLGSQRPGYFGSVAAFSGFVSIQRPETEIGLQAVGQVSYEDIFGPREGPYATGHNPIRLTDNLRHTRLYVTVGNGTDPEGRSAPATAVTGGIVEAGLRLQADELAAAARGSGVNLTYVPLAGVHDWPYWRDHLRAAIAWGLFREVPDRPERWTYRTVARRGEAWGLRFEFAAPPEEVVTLGRDGRRVTGAGSGSVTLRSAAGCTVTATLPFDVAPPPDACVRIRLRVTPRRVRAGRRTRFTFVATAPRDGQVQPVPGALVRLGSRRARTDRRGRARIVARLRGGAAFRTGRVSAPRLLPGRVRIRVLRGAPRRT